MTVYVWVLLSVLTSPGTLATVTVTRTGAPIGGAVPSGTVASTVWPAVVWSTRFCTVMGLPDPAMVIFTVTSNSSFSPWFMNVTLNWVLDPAGTRVTAGDGSSGTSPTL